MTPSRRAIRRLKLMRRDIRSSHRELEVLSAKLAQARAEVEALELILGGDEGPGPPVRILIAPINSPN